MSNEIIQKILDTPIFWRVTIVFGVVWFVYMLFSRSIFKLLSLIFSLINCIWLILYRLFNNLIHIFHKTFGKSLISVDQTITDFFAIIYDFLFKIKLLIVKTYEDKVVINGYDGKPVINENGEPQYSYISKKPFIGLVFILCVLLVLWINAPVWLNIEDKTNILTIAYQRYVEIENRLLFMITSDKNFF